MAVETRIGMPLDEFMEKFSVAPFELIDGEERPLMPTMFEHSEVIRILWTLLVLFQQTHPEIRVYSETAFVLTDLPNWVKGSRVPDLSIYLTERLTAYFETTPDYKQKPLALVPDLVVEIVSPTDQYEEMDTKIEKYLEDGVQIIWLINPRAQTIKVYVQGSSQITRLTSDGTLVGGTVMPEFSTPVKALFE